jgi:hypothetical protein
MPEPITHGPSTAQLLKLLDTIGSEADIRSVLKGGTLKSHLAWLKQRDSPATTS